MREIKFRVWDNRRKEWALNGSNITFPMGTLSKNAIEHGFTLVEFTGIHDKNGKEIYEGDIVNRHLGHPPRVITWTPEGRYLGWYSSRLESQQTKNTMDHLPLEKDEEIEIIGNIYENPELLKAKEGKV